MFDDTQRILWLEQLDSRLCAEFGFQNIEAIRSVSYPSSGARGALERVRPADMDFQWRDAEGKERAFLAVHPMALRSPEQAAYAILWARARREYGVRRGALGLGLHKEPNATISCDSIETTIKVKNILAEVGEPPVGFGVPFPVRNVQRGRMVAYRCTCAKDVTPTVYCGSAKLNVICRTCGNPFVKQ